MQPVMNALVEFDEKEFWIQLFSIAVRREARTEDEDTHWADAADTCFQQEGELGAVR
jgi:hypothetical protein